MTASSPFFVAQVGLRWLICQAQNRCGLWVSRAGERSILRCSTMRDVWAQRRYRPHLSMPDRC